MRRRQRDETRSYKVRVPEGRLTWNVRVSVRAAVPSACLTRVPSSVPCGLNGVFHGVRDSMPSR
eukprot:4590920-Pleurochrysis_carterae.AAC.1